MVDSEENKPTNDQKLIEQDQPIPIEKKCSRCGEIKLLSEFEIDEAANDKHADVCKSCVQHENEEYGKCCEAHFQDMMMSNTFKQLTILLDQLEVIRYNGWEIPHELNKKMFEITHLLNVRCRYDLCSRDKNATQVF